MRLEKYKSFHSNLIQEKIKELKAMQEEEEVYVTMLIDDVLSMLEPLEELRKEAAQGLEEVEKRSLRISKIYFDIASEAIGEDEVRKKRDKILEKEEVK